MLSEDLSVFFDDFGVTATVGETEINVILDSPDEIVSMMDVGVQANIIHATLRSADATSLDLKKGSTMVIAAVTYQVTTPVRRIEDGVLCIAILAIMG